MAKKSLLPKYTLEFDEKRDKWELQKDKTHEVIKRFETKEDATAGGVLKGVLGKSGGSVKIQLKESSRIQEERTYPSSMDPKSSKG